MPSQWPLWSLNCGQGGFTQARWAKINREEISFLSFIVCCFFAAWHLCLFHYFCRSSAHTLLTGAQRNQETAVMMVAKQAKMIRMTVSDGLLANHSGPELLSSISDLSGPRASQKIDVRWLRAFPSPMSIQVRAMDCAKDSTAVALQPGWCISGCALAGVSFGGQSRAMSVLLQIMPAFGW